MTNGNETNLYSAGPSGTTNVEYDFNDVHASSTNYLLMKVDLDQNQKIFGGYLLIERL
jgi:hypothetical protein